MRGWLALSLLFCFPSLARAHDVMGTVIMLDLGHQSVHIEVQLPVDELRLALGQPSRAGVQELPASAEQLGDYVLEHLQVLTPEGEPYALRAMPGAQVLHDDRNWQHIEVDATAPGGADARDFILQTDVIDHRVLSHRLAVFLRRDLEAGQLGAPEFLEQLHYQSHRVRVSREGSLTLGLWTALRLGSAHIAEGSDHLLFLLSLLLPAGLSVVGRRWGPRVPAREAALQVVRVVTAFTIGHSLTLLLAALGLARLSSALVESLIALSVVVSALHALVPLFPGREPLIALGFGLVHGLGFASALEGLGVDGPTLAVTVVGFNLGVELLQIAIVAATLPFIYLLEGSSLGTPFRVLGAALTAVVAVAWFAERALAIATPISAWFDRAFAQAWIGLATLAVVASLSAIRSARRPPRALARPVPSRSPSPAE